MLPHSPHPYWVEKPDGWESLTNEMQVSYLGGGVGGCSYLVRYLARFTKTVQLGRHPCMPRKLDCWGLAKG